MKTVGARKTALVLLVAVLFLFAAFLTVAMFSDELRAGTAAYLNDMGFAARVVASAASVLVAALCVAVLFISDARAQGGPDVTLRDNEAGEVSISCAALETLAAASVRAIEEIRSLKVTADTSEGDIAFTASVSMAQSANIQDVTRRMQAEMAQFVADRVGLPVRGVDIVVSNSASADETALRPRVK